MKRMEPSPLAQTDGSLESRESIGVPVRDIRVIRGLVLSYFRRSGVSPGSLAPRVLFAWVCSLTPIKPATLPER